MRGGCTQVPAVRAADARALRDDCTGGVRAQRLNRRILARHTTHQVNYFVEWVLFAEWLTTQRRLPL